MSEKSLLDRLHVASPCKANWAEMSGDNRKRMCALCTKNVYNISDMSKKDAEAFLKNQTGSICARFYRRRDGTVITDDCPVGMRRVRDAYRTFIKVSSAALFITTVVGFLTDRHKPETSLDTDLSHDAINRLWMGHEATQGAVISPFHIMPPPEEAPKTSFLDRLLKSFQEFRTGKHGNGPDQPDRSTKPVSK